jgi:U3 small nucleolar RNA-associated protein 12
MGCGYALCSVFAPGDRHVVLGTKAGKLQIFDINTGQMTEEVAAHTGQVWAMALTADR